MLKRVVLRRGAGALPERCTWVWLHGMFGGANDVAKLIAFLPICDDVESWILPGHASANEDCSSGTQELPSFEEVAQEIAKKVDEGACGVSRGKCILVGYSMGARFALAAATKRPASLNGVALLSSATGIVDEEKRVLRRIWDESWARRIEEHPRKSHEDWLEQSLFSTLTKIEKREQVKRRLQLCPVSLGRAMRSFGQGLQPPLDDVVCRVDVPVCLLSGALDTKYVASQAALAGILKDASIVVIEGAGHAVHLEKPKEVGAALTHFSSSCSE